MGFLPDGVQNLNTSYEGNGQSRGRKPKDPIPRSFDPTTGRLRDRYTEEKRLGFRRQTGAMKLKKLTMRHRRIIALHINGHGNDAIAFLMNCTHLTVSRVLNDPLAQNFIQRAIKDQDAELNALMGKAVGVIREGLTKEGLSVGDRLKAVDRFTKLKVALKEGEQKAETAEDIIAKMLDRLTIVNNGSMQVNMVPSREPIENIAARVISTPNPATNVSPHAIEGPQGHGGAPRTTETSDEIA